MKTEAIIFTEVNKKLSKLEDTTTQVQKNNFTDMDNKPRKNKKKNKVIEKPNNSRQTPANETVVRFTKYLEANIIIIFLRKVLLSHMRLQLFVVSIEYRRDMNDIFL